MRAPQAERTLAAAIEHSKRTSVRADNYGTTMSAAAEHAGRMAMSQYLGQWWTCELNCDPPEKLGPGDEWFSRATVRAVVEEFAYAVADLAG